MTSMESAISSRLPSDIFHAHMIHGDAVADADGAEFDRCSAGHVNAGLDGLDDFVQMGMAGNDLVLAELAIPMSGRSISASV